MKEKQSVSIIGGQDGSTIFFTAGKSKKKSLKNRLRNYLKQRKRKKAEKKIVAGEHSLEEVVTYAMNRYSVSEVERNEKKYMERWKILKESLVLKYKPELLGDMQEISKPDIQNEDSIRTFFHQIEFRSKRIAQIPDHEVTMDFHVYEIGTEEGHLNLEIDYHWKLFGISYSGSKKAIKQLKKIARELYIYYGVNGNDIREKSERYLSLLEWM